jgi:hypothetical protein
VAGGVVFSHIVGPISLSRPDPVPKFVRSSQTFVLRCHGRKKPQPLTAGASWQSGLRVQFGPSPLWQTQGRTLRHTCAYDLWTCSSAPKICSMGPMPVGMGPTNLNKSRRSIKGSGDLLPPSPTAEKANHWQACGYNPHYGPVAALGQLQNINDNYEQNNVSPRRRWSAGAPILLVHRNSDL